MEFYSAAPRTWAFESENSSLFRLQFYRGDWTFPGWLLALRKTWLARVLPVRRPLAISAESEKAALATRPADLLVRIVPEKRTRLRVKLDYRIFFAGRKAEIPRDERRRWKEMVDEDVYCLQQILTAAYADS